MLNNPSSVPYRLNFALDSWREWGVPISQRPEVEKELLGGKTNQSWLINASGRRFVARLNNPLSGLLGIDRKREFKIQSAVSKLGLAPNYYYLHTPSNTSIFEYLEGKSLAASDLEQPSRRTKVLEVVKSYQSIKVDLPRFNYSYYLSRYWQKVQRVQPVWAKEHVEEWNDFYARLQAFDSESWEPVITHHDLESSNILDTRKGIRIIDWEYSGNSHPSFDRLYLCRSENQVNDILSDLINWLTFLWNLLYEYSHHKAK